MRPEEKMDTKSYKDNKLRIEWDVAWKVFEAVNKNNDSSQYVDLNCLDHNEACNIVKQ